MPSVRVKRDYVSLNDAADQPRSATRPRSYSVFTPNIRPQDEPKDDRVATRARSRTTTSYEPDGQVSCAVRPHRTSRVSEHIATSSRNIPQRPAWANRRDANLSAGMHRGSVARDRPDMMSFEGSQANIMVPANETEPGRIGSALSLPPSDVSRDSWDGEHHDDDVVEHLDVIDPQISTVSTLTNAANAIVIPPLSFYSRKPVVVLPRRPHASSQTLESAEKGDVSHEPHEDNLDFHVEDVLNKRDRFRRVMQGVWSFLKTPIGIVVAIYGFNVVFWGTALVFFLAKFIDLNNANTQGFWVELCQQIETGLFSLPSIGLIPFRAMDTYRILKIWYYRRLTTKLRKIAGLPELYDSDDLPDPVYDANYVHVLSEQQQIDLHYQQQQFMEAQTWYRPHGTQTHRAFPIHIALWICLLNDLNSFFQILLSACMWSMDRFTRPAWTTATTLPAAFVAGILAGFYIYWGGRKTKRVKEVTERLRMALALEHVPDRSSAATSPLPEATTANSTPTMLDHKPRCTDFAVDDGDGSYPLGVQTPSTGIAIADEMTVPSAAALVRCSEEGHDTPI